MLTSLRYRPAAALLGAMLLLSLGRQVVPGFTCPHHVPDAGPQPAQSQHTGHAADHEEPASDHGAGPCNCLGNCLAGSAPILALSSAWSPMEGSLASDGVATSLSGARVASAHLPHVLPLANAPPLGF